jgi:hypothetical protein
MQQKKKAKGKEVSFDETEEAHSLCCRPFPALAGGVGLPSQAKDTVPGFPTFAFENVELMGLLRSRDVI